MEVLSDKAAEAWLNQRGVLLAASRGVKFLAQQSQTFVLSRLESRESTLDLPVNLVGILGSDQDWMLWLTDFDIWSSDTEEIGWMLIEGVLRSELKIDASAFVFSAREALQLKAALIVPLFFSWDAVLVRGDGKVFVVINHDYPMLIATLDGELASELEQSQLKNWMTD